MPVHSRNEQLATFYARRADELRHSISFKVGCLDRTLVDDACAFAWEKLLRRPDIDLDRHSAYSWVYKVAVRRAWDLARAQLREQPAGGLNGVDDDRPEPVGTEADPVDMLVRRLERATIRELVEELHWRERRELLLYAHGLSYDEIAAATGTSHTAVNRWLVRAKTALWEARQRREQGRAYGAAA